MFNKEFFNGHQNVLLWLLNTPIIRVWSRWVLRINGKESSVGKNRIIKILPNSITWRNKKENEYTTEFRLNDYFARKLILPRLFHIWDINFANRFFPSLNLGFDDFNSAAGEGQITNTDTT